MATLVSSPHLCIRPRPPPRVRSSAPPGAGSRTRTPPRPCTPRGSSRRGPSRGRTWSRTAPPSQSRSPAPCTPQWPARRRKRRKEREKEEERKRERERARAQTKFGNFWCLLRLLTSVMSHPSSQMGPYSPFSNLTMTLPLEVELPPIRAKRGRSVAPADSEDKGNAFSSSLTLYSSL